MNLKKYLTLGAGIVTGFGLSMAGLSYAAQNGNKHVNLITSEKAKSIMLGKVPGATILEFSYDGDDKTPKYDGTLIKGDYEYEIDVNAKTGEVSKFEKEKISVSNNNSTGNNNDSVNNKPGNTKPNSTQNNNSYIGESKAKSIMLSKVPGATIKEFHLDKDNTPEYEAELIKGNVEYDISVDAITGAIREFKQEKIYSNSNSNNNSSNNSSSNSNNSNSSNNVYYDDDRYDNDRYDNDDDDRYDDDRYDDDDDDRYDDDRYDNDDDDRYDD